MSDLITISSSVLPGSARVVGFRGAEAISRPYEIDIFLSLPQEAGGEFDLADAIGAKARLVLDRESDRLPPFIFAGVFASVEMLHAFDGHLLIHAVLVPRLWQLGLSRHSRIFTKMKVPDIIKAVLDQNGVTDVELRLGAYDVEEHVCQYHESDLDFISRWMEREGIFYFFEHGEEGETLVLCDERVYDADPVGTPVRYFPQLGHDHSAGPSFRAFRCQHTTLAANVRLKDYDYVKPGLNVSGSAGVASNGSGEVSLYGERFFTPAAGERLARIRAEEMLSRQVLFHGAGARLHLRPGYTFELDDHPFASFNTSYVTVKAHHSGNQAAGLAHFRELTGILHDDVYQVEVEAILAKTQLRAQSVTAWPRIHGSESGVVDGAADSEYAQIDEHGRYNAKFKFDESKLKGGKATTWVRMMQPHGGDIEGFHFPLRKGTEVIFGFLGGDPDRPVISGVVPNTVNPSPITSANHTKNVIQTGGRNRFELEDKAGQQRITMSTPYASTYIRMGAPNDEHEMILHTDEQTLLDAGLDYNVTVSNAGHGDWTTIVHDGDGTLSVPKGNYRIGVLEGVGVNAKNGLTLTINESADVPKEGGEGGLKIEVKTNGAEMIVQEEIAFTSETTDIKLTALAGNVEIDAKQNHSVKIAGTTWEEKTGVSHERILANSWEYRKADSHEEVVGNTFETRHGNKTSEVFGNTTETTTGNTTEITLGNKSEQTTGNTSDITIGNAYEMHGNTQESIDIGLVLEAKLAVAVELTAAIKLAVEMALTLELNFGVRISLQPIEVELELEGNHEKAVALRNELVHMHLGGVNLRTFGLHCHV